MKVTMFHSQSVGLGWKSSFFTAGPEFYLPLLTLVRHPSLELRDQGLNQYSTESMMKSLAVRWTWTNSRYSAPSWVTSRRHLLPCESSAITLSSSPHFSEEIDLDSHDKKLQERRQSQCQEEFSLKRQNLHGPCLNTVAGHAVIYMTWF